MNVYFDNAATTAIRTEVVERMACSLHSCYGNPSSTHSVGRNAKNEIEKARKTIAAEFNVLPSEIIFTSGGTEGNNMILRSAVTHIGVRSIISSEMEHHAVLHTIEDLVKIHAVKFYKVRITPNGHIDLNHLEVLLNETSSEKTLVSLMHINNEIGNKLPISRVAQLCKKYNAWFHSDTVQSVGHYRLDLREIPIDFITASAHKFHGPKGVGFAYIRKNSGLKSFITGGGQERGFRAGTEAVHNIVGMEEAFLQAYGNIQKEQSYIEQLKHYCIEKMKERLPGVIFNGDCENFENSSYTILNVGIPMPDEKAQILLFTLDLKSIACSRGSACQSGSVQTSHVLKAFLSDKRLQVPSLRISFSHYNTKQEVDYLVEVLHDFIKD